MTQKFGEAFIKVKKINSKIKKLTREKSFQILISDFHQSSKFKSVIE